MSWFLVSTAQSMWLADVSVGAVDATLVIAMWFSVVQVEVTPD